MKATTTIQMIPRDITHGVRREPSTCPVARAIRRRAKGYICVGPDQMMIAHSSGDIFPHLPEIARRFIIAFDEEEPVTPISFKLAIPKRLLKPRRA